MTTSRWGYVALAALLVAVQAVTKILDSIAKAERIGREMMREFEAAGNGLAQAVRTAAGQAESEPKPRAPRRKAETSEPVNDGEAVIGDGGPEG